MTRLLKLLLSLASLAISGTVMWASLDTKAESAFQVRLLDYFMLFYGIATIVLLGLAWWQARAWHAHAIAALAATLFLAIAVASFDFGIISGLEAAFLVVVAVALFFNWFAVRIVCGPLAEESPNPSLQRTPPGRSPGRCR